MTITYDPETKTATHVESGLSVRFARWGASIRDQDVYFEVTWKGRTKEFEATFIGSSHRVRRLYPHLSLSERRAKLNEIKEIKFTVGYIGIDVYEALREDPEFGKKFVETWWHAASGPNCEIKTIVEFKPFFDPADGQWECGR